MGKDDLCDVTHYADRRYYSNVPAPTPFPTEEDAACLQSQKDARLEAMKATLLRRDNHRHHHDPAINNSNKDDVEDDAADATTATAGVAVGAPTTATAVVAAAAATTTIDGVDAATDRPAANQALVHEFLADGSALLNGATLSGYPVYGHRTADERNEALRVALFDGDEWRTVPQLPSRRRVVSSNNKTITTIEGEADNNAATTTATCNGDDDDSISISINNTAANTDATTAAAAAAAASVVGESREQYWRRLARYYISKHAAEAAAATTDDGSATSGEPEDPFYMVDLGRVIEQMALWRRCLPMVRPHFAVKCNPNPAIIEVLAAMGAGFDCASRAEIDLILDGGKQGPGSLVGSTDDIIFANPCKQPGDLKAAAARGVNYVTLDSVLELQKIAKYMPNAKAVIRIRTNDAHARNQFSVKFGAPLETVDDLLDAAIALHVDIYGVSFHVGSGNNDPAAYTAAVRDAHWVFTRAARKGINCTLVDIGGGYPGTAPTAAERAAGVLGFEDIAAALRPVIEELFPRDGDTRIIAEPGRYFTAATHALAANVFAARTLRISDTEREVCRRTLVADKGNGVTSQLIDMDSAVEHQYYINDGIYGSFNNIMFDCANPGMLLLDDADGADGNRNSSSIDDDDDEEEAGATTATTVVVTQSYAPAGNNSNSDSSPIASIADAAYADAVARRSSAPRRPLCVTTVYGPTCDSLDCVLKKRLFPEMSIGDWVLVPDMGSYTTAAGSAFNGFYTHRREWICSVDI